MVKTIKRTLDPNNIMNPGKQMLDEAYEEVELMSIWRLGDQRPPEPRPIRDGVVMRFDHVYEVDPDADADVPAAEHAGVGHQAHRRQPLGVTWTGCTTTSPTR